ncbi:hypothetical protein EVAR_2706_1 [Eumeta japonica]|uniref:Uncharacterized protein n=1 Tax=Eumeta variegata TaxID=151549 RepID=A0A4C1SPQ2_EUMVA|nr:hypothetical protein EVAR_2706_1 [Eumeta japonica]
MEPECQVPDLVSVSPFRKGRTNFAFYSASVGVDLRPNQCETVHYLGVKVLELSYPISSKSAGATLRWTALSIFRTPSFPVTGAQAHEAYRIIRSITVTYMVAPRPPDSDPTSPWPFELGFSNGNKNNEDETLRSAIAIYQHSNEHQGGYAVDLHTRCGRVMYDKSASALVAGPSE